MRPIFLLLFFVMPLCIFAQSKEADELYNKGYALYKSRQAHLAVPYLEKSDSLEKAELKKTSPNYNRSANLLIVCWTDLVSYYSSIHDTTETIRLQTLIVDTERKNKGSRHPDYFSAKAKLDEFRMKYDTKNSADEYYEKGMNLYKTKQAHLAVPYLEKSDSLEKAQLKKSSPKYNRSELALTNCWSDLAKYNFSINDTTETIRLQTLVVNSRKKILGKTHPDYLFAVQTLNNYKASFGKKTATADDYYNQGMAIYVDNPYPAIDFFHKSDSIEKATLDPSSPNYYRSERALIEYCWLRLSNYYSRMRNYYEAIKFLTLAEKSAEKFLPKDDELYLDIIFRLALWNDISNNHSEELRYFIKYAECVKLKYGEEHDNYISAVRYIASAYDYLGNQEEAFHYKKLALQLGKKVYGEEHIKYINLLRFLARDYEVVGSPEAIRYSTLAVDLSKKAFGEESREYASALNELARIYSNCANDTAAYSLGKKSLELSRKIYGEKSSEYATSLSGLANYYARAAYQQRGGSYPEAIRLQLIAVDIFEKNAVEDDKKDTVYRFMSDYGRECNRLAQFYHLSGNNTEAVKWQTRAIEHDKQYRYNGLPYTDSWWSYLAEYQLAAGEHNEGAELYKEIYINQMRDMSGRFAFLSNEERAKEWNEGSFSVFFSKNLPYAAYKSKDGEMAALAYNGIVFSKGFLLNSELEIQTIIEQKGNSVLKNRYMLLKNNRAKLDSLLQLSPDLRGINVDSLQQAVFNEEHELVALSKELGSYVDNLSIDWKEIQKNLKDGDMAVEFSVIDDDETQNKVYVAIVLKQGMTSPQLVKLFDFDAFAGIKFGEYYRTPKLYNIVWKPMAKYLDGVKNVYFSPTGKFHTIGIEYLPDEKGRIFAEKYAAYRLSSTRELALAHINNPEKKAATFGGIRYEKNDGSTHLRGGGADYLGGTKIESDSVASLLRAANYEIAAYSDTVATEESFKNLSGSGLKILHVGTHGFYFEESEMNNYDLDFLVNKSQSDEDRALSCSGLLFAGANASFISTYRNSIPEGGDGILTAKEISRLDFRGLDLVVLSACQSGLGEVTGEGVFGLQRGFKKAGAQTIVMSLWNVNDDATQLLMTEFFKNLTAGHPKREAFVMAQSQVRKKYPHPAMWAAFVMVDGL